MDPITKSLEAFNAQVAKALAGPDVRIVLVSTSPEHVPLLTKSLRALEWDGDNRSPYLIHSLPLTTPDDAFAALESATRQHYALLRKGLAEEGVELRPLTPPNAGAGSTDQAFAAVLLDFQRATEGVLHPPVLCWLPTKVVGPTEWAEAAVRLLGLLWNTPIRFILLAPPDGALADYFEPDAAPMLIVPFSIDDAAAQDHFAKLLGPPAAGRAPGTLPGSAAPDVVPPARPHPAPSDEAVRAELAKAGIEGVLERDAAERLRSCVFEAGAAAGRGDGELALLRQSEACELCRLAGARIEEVMMALLLAAYEQQFGHPLERVESTYRRAEQVAGDAGAYPQLAQTRLAIAYLLFSNARIDEAVSVYEQAAFAALVGGVNMLLFEALRLAGTGYMQLGRAMDAELCWASAVRHARTFAPEEVRLTEFTTVSSQLIDLLYGQGRENHARAVAEVVAAVGAAAQNGGEA